MHWEVAIQWWIICYYQRGQQTRSKSRAHHAGLILPNCRPVDCAGYCGVRPESLIVVAPPHAIMVGKIQARVVCGSVFFNLQTKWRHLGRSPFISRTEPTIDRTSHFMAVIYRLPCTGSWLLCYEINLSIAGVALCSQPCPSKELLSSLCSLQHFNEQLKAQHVLSINTGQSRYLTSEHA